MIVLNKRRRSARAKFSFFVILSAAACALIVIAFSIFLLQPVTLRFAVRAASGDGRLASTLERVFSRERSSIRLSQVTVPENADLENWFKRGDADFAISRASTQPSINVQAVAVLKKNSAIGWSWSEKGTKNSVDDFTDLAGVKVAVLNPSTEDFASMKDVLSLADVEVGKIDFVWVSPEQLSKTLADTSIRAAVWFTNPTNKALAKALSDTARTKADVKILGISNSEAIAQTTPPYESVELSSGLFKLTPMLPKEEITTIALSDLIVARRSLSEDHVAAFTSQIFSNRQSLAQDDPQLVGLETPDTGKSAAISVHTGSAAFIDGTERTFLEKYSDLMWGTLLLLSGMGTAGAWFRSRLLQSEREHNLTLRERLVTLLDQIPDAETLDQLAQMRKAADQTFRDTMICFEDGAIDEGSLTSFSVVLAQFNHAISNRARELLIKAKRRKKTARKN